MSEKQITVTLRLTPGEHKRLKVTAALREKTIKDFIIWITDEYLRRNHQTIYEELK